MTDPGGAPHMQVHGADLVPDPGGAVYWPQHGLLIFADLHLEKGSAYAQHGVALPPYDTRATLLAMAAACAKFEPRRVVCLGDSFHDVDAGARIAADDMAALRALTDAHDWIWIAGNHDPELPRGTGGQVATELNLGPLTFRHAPVPGPAAGEVVGHLHPCARVRVRSRTLRRRCFATDGMRLVLPAFGAYTGGLDVLDAAFTPVFPGRFHAWMLAVNSVHRVAHTRLARAIYKTAPR